MDKHYICRRMFLQVLRPSLIAALAMALANMADAVVVGNRLGENGLAAIGVVTPLYMIYDVAGFAFSTGGCVTHSRLTAALTLRRLWDCGQYAVKSHSCAVRRRREE